MATECSQIAVVVYDEELKNDSILSSLSWVKNLNQL